MHQRARRAAPMVVVLVAGMVLGATMMSPVGAHVGGSIKHLWSELKPKATKTFFTKPRRTSD